MKIFNIKLNIPNVVIGTLVALVTFFYPDWSSNFAVSAQEIQNKGNVDKQSNSDIVIEGKCGEHVQFKLEKGGTLKISGTGEMFDYYKLEDIPWYEYKDNILDLVIEEGITAIGSSAFRQSNISKLDIPKSVEGINEFAFYNCENLKQVNLHDGLMYINYSAFEGTAISKLKVPNTVKNIGARAFANCKYLKAVALSAYREYCKYFYEDTFVDCNEDLIVTDNMSYGQAHYNEKTKKIWVEGDSYELSWSLDYAGNLIIKTKSGIIPEYECKEDVPWFSWRDNIVNVFFCGGVTEIGAYAFTECTRLKELYEISSSINVLELSRIRKIGYAAFSGCKELKKNIPWSENLNYLAFENSGIKLVDWNNFKNNISLNVKTLEDAGRILRQGMLDHKKLIAIDIDPNAEDFKNQKLNDNLERIYSEALKEIDGKSNCGDYLRYSIIRRNIIIKNNICFFNVKYSSEKEVEEKFRSKIPAILNELDLSNQSYIQKIKIIFDYATQNAKYDYTLKRKNAYDAVFGKKRTTCLGFVRLFYYLCKEAGIQVRILHTHCSGIGYQHVCCIVKIGDLWYIVDPTFDSGVLPENQKYFLLGKKSYTIIDGLVGDTNSDDWPIADDDYITVAVETMGNGEVSKSDEAGYGKDFKLCVSPGIGCILSSITVNGQDMTESVNNNELVIPNVCERLEIKAIFKENTEFRGIVPYDAFVNPDIYSLRVRKGPGTNYGATGEYKHMQDEVKIIEVKSYSPENEKGWGRIESENGEEKWISLSRISVIPFKVLVNTGGINLRKRKDAGTNFDKVGSVADGTVVTIIDVKPGKGSSAGWGLLEDRSGWVALDYVIK